MKWITEITLNNFRAFGKPETIKIPKGNHLLIYGENGSGKSSIYNGLKDFFSSSSGTTTFKLNKFEDAKNNKAGSVEIDIDEGGATPSKFKFAFPDAGSNHRIDKIILANKFKGFLDYKRMLKVHSLEIPEDKKPDFFELLVRELLSEHKVADPRGGVTKVELLAEYKRLIEILTKTKSGQATKTKAELQERLYAIDEELDNLEEESENIKDLTETSISTKISLGDERESITDAIKIVEAKEQLAKLDGSLKALLGQVIIIANKFLGDHFKNKISIDINYGNLRYNERANTMNESLSLKINYAGTEIEFYQAFLNEARLSSLAICLYLASIKTFEPGEEALKVLYLDDVFIGLDTSNRFPLLEIVKQEFIDDGFQVFISSYDREWFELSRHWFQTKLKGKITSLELFIEDDGNPATPDYPVIIPFDGNIEKAKALFKSKDYPAAGNYLRKECELILKNLLPATYKIDGTGSLIDDFEGLLIQLDKFYDDCNLAKPTEFTDAVKIYRKALLNPSSHSDSKSPLFRKEIQDAFDMVARLETLEKISRTQVADKGRVFIYENTANNYRVEIELVENIWKVAQPSGNIFSKCKFRIRTWTWNGTEYATDATGTVMEEQTRITFCEQAKTLEKVFENINYGTGIPIPTNLNAEIRIGATGTLYDLLQ